MCVSTCPTVTLSRVSTKHFAMVGWAHAPPFLRGLKLNEWCSYQSWTKISADLTKEWPAILAESFLIDQQSCQHRGGTNLSRWHGFGNHWEHLSSIHIRCSLSKPRKQWTCLLDVQYFWLCTYFWSPWKYSALGLLPILKIKIILHSNSDFINQWAFNGMHTRWKSVHDPGFSHLLPKIPTGSKVLFCQLALHSGLQMNKTQLLPVERHVRNCEHFIWLACLQNTFRTSTMKTWRTHCLNASRYQWSVTACSANLEMQACSTNASHF